MSLIHTNNNNYRHSVFISCLYQRRVNDKKNPFAPMSHDYNAACEFKINMTLSSAGVDMNIVIIHGVKRIFK